MKARQAHHRRVVHQDGRGQLPAACSADRGCRRLVCADSDDALESRRCPAIGNRSPWGSPRTESAVRTPRWRWPRSASGSGASSTTVRGPRRSGRITQLKARLHAPRSKRLRLAARARVTQPAALHSIGTRVSETTAEITIVTASVTANSWNSRPTTSPMNSSGISTARSDTVSEMMVKPISLGAASAPRCSGFSPSST